MRQRIELVGFERFDNAVKQRIITADSPLVEKCTKIFGEEHFFGLKIKLDKVRERGDHIIYEVKGTIEASGMSIYAVSSNREILNAMDELVDELKRQLLKMKEKSLKQREGRGV